MNGGHRVIGIVLASGRGLRFDPRGGQNKLLALLTDGEPVLAVAVRTLRSVLDDVIVTVRPGAKTVIDCLRDQSCHILECPEAALGMGAAMAAAVKYAGQQYPDAVGCLLAFGDMPFLQRATVVKLVAAMVNHELVAPVYEGRRGHPVGFARTHFGALESLSGDEGARNLLEGAGERLCCLPVLDKGVVADIDRPDDLIQDCAQTRENSK